MKKSGMYRSVGKYVYNCSPRNLSLTDEITTIDKDNLSSGLIRQADGSVGLMS